MTRKTGVLPASIVGLQVAVIGRGVPAVVLEELDVAEDQVSLSELVQIDQTAHTDTGHEAVLAVKVRYKLNSGQGGQVYVCVCVCGREGRR